MHRFIVAASLSALLVGASVVSAAPVTVQGLSPLPRSLPERCTKVAYVPPSARIPGPELAAHVSVANCLAESAMNELALASDDASIAKLDQAVAPSLAILDNVIRVGDPYWKLIAEDAKRDIYAGMIVRERGTVPGTDVVARNELEPKLARWQSGAEDAIAAILELGHEHPALAQRDPMIAGVMDRTATMNRTPQMARLSGR